MLKRNYKFRTPPFDHQREVFNLSADLEEYGFTMEQGTGKSKSGVDTIGYLFEANKIDCAVIVGPSESDIPLNWLEQFATHLPTRIPHRIARFYSDGTSAQRKAIDRLTGAPDNKKRELRILTINIEAMRIGMTGHKLVKKFLQTFGKNARSLMLVDESTRIKTPNSAQTKGTIRLGLMCGYKRIATGTMITKGPFDAFSQLGFLNPSILGFESFTAFKSYYCEMLPPHHPLVKHMAKKIAKGNETVAERLAQVFSIQARDKDGHPIYKNQAELADKIASVTYRKLKKDCLDLPPKLYERRYVDLTSAQRSIYNAVRDEVIAEFYLMKEKHRLSIPIALTRIRRLLQILGNHVMTNNNLVFDPDSDALPKPGGELRRIENSTFKKDGSIMTANPRVACLLDILEDADPEAKSIIWCMHHSEIEEVVRHLSHVYPDQVLELHGRIKNKIDVKNQFQNDPRKTKIVAQIKSGIGVDLYAATLEVFYTNDISLENRLQAEDRAHRAGQTKNVTIFDIEAKDTLDGWIVDTLRYNKHVAEQLLKDDPVTWL